MAIRWRLVAGNWKVVYQSLSARSDLSIGDVIQRFYFDGISSVSGLRKFLCGNEALRKSYYLL